MIGVVNQNTQSITAHNAAKNRYLLRGELHLTHALHLGSGRGDERTDATVMVEGRKDSSGRFQPIIPGSSLRGALRARVERLLYALNESQITPMWSCGLYDTAQPGERICVGNLSHAPSKAAYQSLLDASEGDVDAVWERLPNQLCDACRLFGAGTFWASKVRFTDLTLTAPAHRQVRHGVGIHRDTGTAAPGIKYDREVVDSGAVFQFEVVAENLDQTDKAILALALSQLLAGEIPLGGSTSRGLGGCILKNAEVYWVDMASRPDLIAYLSKSPTLPPEQRYPHHQGAAEFVETNMALLLPPETGGDHAQDAAE